MSRRPRDEVTLARPRVSVWHVIGRVRIRLLEIQVWDVAGTMTFYLLLSVLPAAIALVSLVGLLGFQGQTVSTLTELFREIFPTVDSAPYVSALLAMSRTSGGVTGILLGALGSLISASNGVAAFHRALHHVYDTREGRPFLRFRTIVLAETVAIIALVVFATAVVAIGGEWSERLGAVVGVSSGALAAWNLAKWPLLLVMLTLAVSLAYHLFPNVRLPRYRPVTLGSSLSVLVLFGSALLVGRLAPPVMRVSDVLPALNGVIALLLLVWLANIVIVAGAALDAEMLRARQIALGLPSGGRILLAPHARHSLDFLERDAQEAARTHRAVAEAAHAGASLTVPRGADVVDASNPLAIDPGARTARAIRAVAPDEHPAAVVATSRDAARTDPGGPR